jgi:hypothetical protein
MAKYSEGPMGPFIGKLGPVVGGIWKGQPYMRTRPIRRAKITPNEKLNHDKFALLHKWLNPLLYILRIGFKGYSPTVEGYNAAKSYNLRNAFILADGKYQLDPATVLVSHGSINLPANLSCELVGKALHFSWENKEPGWVEDPHDRTLLLAYQPESINPRGIPDIPYRKYFTISGARREERKDILQIDNPGTYHIYFAFLANDRSSQSNSCYLGTVEVG